MKKPSLKERFRYWFDDRMSKGSLTLIRFLIAVSVLVALVLALLIILLGFGEEGETASIFWNSFATLLNAWMPYYEEGSPGYLVLMSLIAIAGVLFTSVLIGIITSAIEERILAMKQGNSKVLEEGHTVLLGYSEGENTLLTQLILAAGSDPACIVVAEEMERDEMVAAIRQDVDVPKNVRIICRNVDITSPGALDVCSIGTCRSVVISPADDTRVVKTILAVAALERRENYPAVPIQAILNDPAHDIPHYLTEKHRITALQTHNTLAKMIAHACTQPGLSETFKEVFNFEGSDFYLISLPGAEGLSFRELLLRTDHATPVGISRGAQLLINPSGEECLQKDDRLLVFSEEKLSAVLLPESASRAEAAFSSIRQASGDPEASGAKTGTSVAIFGYNETLPVILEELPVSVSRVLFIGSEYDETLKEEILASILPEGKTAEWFSEEIEEDAFLDLIRMVRHVVILNDYEKEEEDSDMEVIFLLLKLRDLRARYGLQFNVTAELERENNEALVADADSTDFVVASNMSSLILAQISENPELIGVFREILSNEGNELYQKTAGELSAIGEHSAAELRILAFDSGYILLGYIKDGAYTFNPSLDSKVLLSGQDTLIVLGEE